MRGGKEKRTSNLGAASSWARARSVQLGAGLASEAAAGGSSRGARRAAAAEKA